MALSCNNKTINIAKKNNATDNDSFYYLNCVHLFRTINKLESYRKVRENKDFFG